jgi:hypothetical protein
MMHLNDFGRIVEYAWNDLPNHYPHICLDEFQIMPNHIHGIIQILPEICVATVAPVETGLRPVSTGPHDPHDFTAIPQTIKTRHHGLSEIMRALESFSSRRINQLRKTPGTPVWQSRPYDHIIRNDDELNRIRRYIRENPAHWEDDRNKQPMAIAKTCEILETEEYHG